MAGSPDETPRRIGSGQNSLTSSSYIFGSPGGVRLLALEGAINLRDFGGYPTTLGGQVRSGLLFRSGSMHFLSAADERRLAALGIATVWDLRRPDERAAEPTRWCAPANVEILSNDHHQSSGVLEEMLRQADLSPAMTRRAMLDLYRALADEHAASYRSVFARLLEGRVPLLLHCAAGKDRTGVGVALILSALDVPRATIVADYAVSAEVIDFDRLLRGRFRHLARESLAPLLASEPAYLETLFADIDARHGSIDAYLEAMLGVGPPERARLRKLLVTA